MWCVQRRACPRPLHLNLFPTSPTPLINYHESIKQEHARRGVPIDKILVLENGVDIQRFLVEDDNTFWKRELNLDPQKMYAIYSGHLYLDKGIDVIIAVAERLQSRTDVEFILVGGLDKWRRHWERYCQQRQINNVRFTGFVPNAQVPQYLKAADCLLLPYRLDMEHKVMDIHTTSPIKLFEYMAAKRAIIATGIPSVSKVLQHNRNALLAEPGDLDTFSKLIERVLDRPELNQYLGSRAYSDVQQFTWEERCKTILASLTA